MKTQFVECKNILVLFDIQYNKCCIFIPAQNQIVMIKEDLLAENAQLKQRIAELEDILDKIPASIYINQIEEIGDMESGKNIWSNQYAKDFAGLGYPQEEVTAMGARYIEAVMHPDDWVVGEDSITHLLNKDSTSCCGIYKSVSRVLYHREQYKWCYGHTTVFKTKPDGTPWQFINASIDIDEYQHTMSQLDDVMKEVAKLKNQLKLQSLTKRELEILKLIAQGLNDESIAEKLFISRHTVHTHRNKLVKKTATGNTAALVAFAVKCGLG